MPKKRPARPTELPPDPPPAAPVPCALAVPDEAAAVEQAVRWLLDGNRDADVLEAIVEAFPGLPALAIAQAAIHRLAEAGEIDPAIVRGFVFEATKELYRKMVGIGDFAGALRALKQLLDMARE